MAERGENALAGLSPRSYKAKVSQLVEEVDVLRTQLRQLIDAVKQYQHSGSVRDAFLFSDVVKDFGVRPGGIHGRNVTSIGETLDKVENMKRSMLESMEGLFSTPLETFLTTDLKEIDKYQQQANLAKEEYTAAQLKYDVSRTSTVKTAKQEKSLQELEDAKRKYELLDVTYANKLLEMQALKDFEVVERLCTFMFTQLQFYKDATGTLAALEPTVRKMMNQLVNARQEFTLRKSQVDVEKLLAQKLAGKPDISIKQGYLYVKKRNNWSKKWFVVSGGQMYIYKNWKAMNPIQTLNLLLCSVKEIPDPDRQDCFMMFSPDIQMTLQAIGSEDMAEWIHVIQDGIEEMLKKEKKGDSEPTKDTKEKFNYLQILREVPENRLCADCSAPDPEWGLMNLGVLICYQCSGVHRSLGVHISKVRSLTLDHWETEAFHIIKTIGNKNANAIWEATVGSSSDFQKLTIDADRAAREAYIRAKYDHRRFVEPPEGGRDELERKLRGACAESNIVSILRYLAQGCDINHYVGDPTDKQTLLHHVVREGVASSFTVELLTQNGAKIYAMDAKGWTPLHYAAASDRVSYSRILVLRGASATADDKQGVTPTTLAQTNNSEQVQRLFRGELDDVQLPMYPADEENLKHLKSTFSSTVQVVKSKLTLLRQQLAVARTMDEAKEIMQRIRVLTVTLCEEDAEEDAEDVE